MTTYKTREKMDFKILPQNFSPAFAGNDQIGETAGILAAANLSIISYFNKIGTKSDSFEKIKDKPITETVKLINSNRLVDSFIKLVKIDSGSSEKASEIQIPSTECQKNIANELKNELIKIGLDDVKMDDNFIVTATLNANTEKEGKTVGLLAHYDTDESVPNKNINPQIHDYKSGDIMLKDNTIIPKTDLKLFQNQKIITSDGTTLLGADDKAGIAEIIEALNVFKENKDLKHPKIRIAFTPDEETGNGIPKFDIKAFGADVAYTVDGDFPNRIENETFNAFNPEIIIKGKNVHTGYAKGKMINSIDIASWLVEKLPKSQKPQNTEGTQGFFHINGVSGTVSETKINMLVRDHDYKKAQNKISLLKNLIKKAESKFGCTIEMNSNERYRNMKEYIDNVPEVMEYAKEGLKLSGFMPEIVAIRGGTDGSQLSLRGLPTPNLGAGGLNFHSKSEFLPVSNLEKCCENIINILQVWAKHCK